MRHLVRQRWIHFMLHNLVWLIQFSHAKRKHQSPLGWIVAALVNIYECPVLYALGSQSGWQRDLGLFLPPQDHCMWAKVQLIIINFERTVFPWQPRFPSSLIGFLFHLVVGHELPAVTAFGLNTSSSTFVNMIPNTKGALNGQFVAFV